MRVKLFTLRYSATLGSFDETPVAEFTRDKELLGFREHFFVVQRDPAPGVRALLARYVFGLKGAGSRGSPRERWLT